jgi:hypothetical protein
MSGPEKWEWDQKRCRREIKIFDCCGHCGAAFHGFFESWNVAEEQRRTGGVSPYGDAIKELQRIAEVMVKGRLMG